MIVIEPPQDLNRIAQRLSRAAGLPVQLVASIDSSNSALLADAAQLPLHPHSPCGLVALSQTAGRGRRGRVWQTAMPAQAFLASLGVRTAAALPSMGLLPLHIGVAVVEQLRAWGCAALLKWPNDVVVDTAQGSAKLGGILVETRSIDDQTAMVMGMGLNWHSAPQLADRLTATVAAQIDTLLDDITACAALLAAMHLGWERTMAQLPCAFAAVDALHGQTITWRDSNHEEQQGVARGINDLGHLGVQTAAGLVWLHSGEVSIKV
jgi:BirA family transcriptional regulator, biotin operon repressor / biotin---[acetyl-CoA-carboxylase] ligase